MTDHELFMTSSESLLAALKNDRPLEFCWRVLHEVTNTYMRIMGMEFLLFTPAFDRAEIELYVEDMQHDVTERINTLIRNRRATCNRTS